MKNPRGKDFPNRRSRELLVQMAIMCFRKQCCGSGSVSIPNIFQYPDPGSVPGCLGSRSRSIKYSNEQNKIIWKGKFNKYAVCFGPVGPTDKENQAKMYKSTILGLLPLWNGKDPYQSEKPDLYQKGLDPQHCPQVPYILGKILGSTALWLNSIKNRRSNIEFEEHQRLFS